MGNTARIGLGLLIAYGVYSLHFVWLLHRTSNECQQMTNAHVDQQQLKGAQRVCSASGFDTSIMLKRIFAAN